MLIIRLVNFKIVCNFQNYIFTFYSNKNISIYSHILQVIYMLAFSWSNVQKSGTEQETPKPVTCLVCDCPFIFLNVCLFILCNLYKDMNVEHRRAIGIFLKEFCLCGMWKHSKIEASGKSQFILSQKRLFPWELLEVMAVK